MHVESKSLRPLLRAAVTAGATVALVGTTLAPAASATPAASAPLAPVLSPTVSEVVAGIVATQDSSATKRKGRPHSGVGKAITPEEAFARGEHWLNPPVPYSMSAFTSGPNGKSYRTDCSGFVSMAWHLPNSETTVTLPESTVETISWDSLAPGDAVNRALPGGNGHVMLVEEVKGSTVHVMEQTPPQVTRSTHDKATLSATGYDPVRYKNMMAVSEEDVREQIEKRMSTLEERINERLGEEVGEQARRNNDGGASAGVAGAAAPDNKDRGGNKDDDNKDEADKADDALPDLNPTIQPPGSKTLVNFESIFHVRDEAYQEVIEMPDTGTEVEVYAEQTAWTWNWDDGSDPEPSTHSGNPYPETPRVSHQYDTAGTYQPSVDVEWGNYRYRIVEQDEEWINIEGDTTTALQFPDLEVLEVQNVLSD